MRMDSMISTFCLNNAMLYQKFGLICTRHDGMTDKKKLWKSATISNTIQYNTDSISWKYLYNPTTS